MLGIPRGAVCWQDLGFCLGFILIIEQQTDVPSQSSTTGIHPEAHSPEENGISPCSGVLSSTCLTTLILQDNLRSRLLLAHCLDEVLAKLVRTPRNWRPLTIATPLVLSGRHHRSISNRHPLRLRKSRLPRQPRPSPFPPLQTLLLWRKMVQGLELPLLSSPLPMTPTLQNGSLSQA